MERKESVERRFFTDLKPVKVFSESLNPSQAESAPQDWFLVQFLLKDHGLQRDQNTAAALGILALANLSHDMDLPFVFQGDGALMLVPPDLGFALWGVLEDYKKQMKTLFHLEPVVKVFPLESLRNRGADIKVSRLRVSPYYNQAGLFFIGGNLLSGEGADPGSFHRREDADPQLKADFTGFSSRWQAVTTPLDKTISLVVDPLTQDPAELDKEIEAILSRDSGFHPLSEQNLKWARRVFEVGAEARVVSGAARGSQVWWAAQGILWKNRWARLVRFLRLPVRKNWQSLAQIRHFHLISSAFRQFDGRLRMVVAVKQENLAALESFLQAQQTQGKLAYGLVVSDRCHMNSIAYYPSRREVHFLDGGDGGLALAQKRLEESLNSKGK